jgi:hypothetical protein
MDTQALIEALAGDLKPLHPLERQIALATGLGFALALVVRADLGEALTRPAFLLKMVVVVGLAVSSFGLVCAAARPGSRLPKQWIWAVAAVMAASIAMELTSYPSAQWAPRLVGQNAVACLWILPALSAAPLAMILLTLRRGAATRPALAGAMAGLLAGSVGAVLYATYCPDDAALFVAMWYPLAISIVAAAGAVSGWATLRW